MGWKVIHQSISFGISENAALLRRFWLFYMMKFHLITDHSPEDVRIFANLRNYEADTHFIAESEKVVSRLLRSHIEIISMYLTEDQFHSIKELISSHRQESECNVFIGSREEMEKIVGFSLHQRILAAAKIPIEKDLEQLLADAKKPLLFVILDEVADAENMGAIFRTSFAMNTTAVIVDKKSVSPWMRRSVRVSMGAVFELPVVTVGSIPDCIELLRGKNIPVFATTLNESAGQIWNCDLSKDCAIVFGSEGHGIKKEIINACESEVTIPMRDNFHSLNVGTAHGIFLYEVIRQRSLAN